MPDLRGYFVPVLIALLTPSLVLWVLAALGVLRG